MADHILHSKWIIDSGATDHICSNINMFLTYKPVTGISEHIVTPDGGQIPILHTSSVKVLDMVLYNVLNIPTLQYNLNVQRLCKD